MEKNIFRTVSLLVDLRQALQGAGFINISFESIKREYIPEKLFFKCQMRIKNNIKVALAVCEYTEETSITISKDAYKLIQKKVEVHSINELVLRIQELVTQFKLDSDVLEEL